MFQELEASPIARATGRRVSFAALPSTDVCDAASQTSSGEAEEQLRSEVRELRRRMAEMQRNYFEQLTACSEKKDREIERLTERLATSEGEVQGLQQLVLDQQRNMEELETTIAVQTARLTMASQANSRRATELKEVLAEAHQNSRDAQATGEMLRERERQLEVLQKHILDLEDVAETRRKQIQRLTTYVRLTLQTQEDVKALKARLSGAELASLEQVAHTILQVSGAAVPHARPSKTPMCTPRSPRVLGTPRTPRTPRNPGTPRALGTPRTPRVVAGVAIPRLSGLASPSQPPVSEAELSPSRAHTKGGKYITALGRAAHRRKAGAHTAASR